MLDRCAQAFPFGRASDTIRPMGGWDAGAIAMRASLLALVIASGCGDDASSPIAATDDASAGTTRASDADGSAGSSAASSDESADTTAGEIVSPDLAIVELVRARCDWLFGCCDAGETALAVGPFTVDADDCVERVIAALQVGNVDPPIAAGPTDRYLLLAQSFAGGRIAIVPDAVTACADALRSVPCNEPPPTTDPTRAFCVPDRTAVDACALATMVTGLVAIDEPCEPALGVECAEGLACIAFGQSGTCITSSQAGDYCFSDLDCTPPHYCDLHTGLCAKASAEGEPCAYEDPEIPAPGTELLRCEIGLACDPVAAICVGECSTGSPCAEKADCPAEHECVLARCVIPQGPGAPCLVGADCTTGFCDSGNCAALGGTNDPCVPHAQCESGFCHPFTDTCRPKQGDGQPCTSFADAECEDGVCDNSDPLAPICVAWIGPGGACTSNLDCSPNASLACIDGVCQSTPLANGASCFNGPQCASQLCWQGQCDDPAGVGDPCTSVFDPTIKPCGASTYCDVADGAAMGSCAAKLASGQACTGDDQCWGACILVWGQRLCDATAATGEAWCDGA